MREQSREDLHAADADTDAITDEMTRIETVVKAVACGNATRAAVVELMEAILRLMASFGLVWYINTPLGL